MADLGLFVAPVKPLSLGSEPGFFCAIASTEPRTIFLSGKPVEMRYFNKSTTDFRSF